MGRFTYGPKITVDFDDRVLVHLQTVISAKLRRGESFMFTWIDDDSTGDGRTSVWLHPATAIGFKYFGKRVPHINRQWIELLMLSANSVGGLHIVPEPPEAPEEIPVNGHGQRHTEQEH
jgi:hypothetical protein